ncbi:MAG TPA: T9SS type A sorting domain-containing protein [Bacteroidia bacterium]|jgi:hypothetical protein|nr:T9SS type A sorting domain-containing protein [Bacteroidia bacterium]
MKKYLSILLILALPILVLGQARVILNGAYVVLNGGIAATPIYLDVSNSATNAIKQNSGWIISESEFNMVKWDIGTNTGTYTIPFGYNTVDYIPLTFNILTAGAPAAGTVKFSTYHTCADNWTCNPPSDVTQMDPSNIGLSSPSATDDSYWVIDRFWIIDANTGYTTKPSPNLKFTYIDNGVGTEVAGPNIFAESQLLAQRFNSTNSTWGDYVGTAGTDVIASPVGTCKNDPATAIAPADFFRSWTLSSQNDPLPIQLSAFNIDCNNGVAIISWTSATEINNAYYTIEKTADGNTYETVATVKGAGNSSMPLNYSVTDYDPLPGTSYYRLSQTDLDGKTTHFAPITFQGCKVNGTTINAFNSNGTITVRISSEFADGYTITLVNTLGQVILNEEKSLPAGYNEFILNPGMLSKGIYLINIRSERANYNRKLVLGTI